MDNVVANGGIDGLGDGHRLTCFPRGNKSIRSEKIARRRNPTGMLLPLPGGQPKDNPAVKWIDRAKEPGSLLSFAVSDH